MGFCGGQGFLIAPLAYVCSGFCSLLRAFLLLVFYVKFWLMAFWGSWSWTDLLPYSFTSLHSLLTPLEHLSTLNAVFWAENVKQTVQSPLCRWCVWVDLSVCPWLTPWHPVKQSACQLDFISAVWGSGSDVATVQRFLQKYWFWQSWARGSITLVHSHCERNPISLSWRHLGWVAVACWSNASVHLYRIS